MLEEQIGAVVGQDVTSLLCPTLWSHIMAFVPRPGSLILSNKYFYNTVFKQFADTPTNLTTYFSVTGELQSRDFRTHPLFLQAKFQKQAAVLQQLISNKHVNVLVVDWAAANGCTGLLKAVLRHKSLDSSCCQGLVVCSCTHPDPQRQHLASQLLHQALLIPDSSQLMPPLVKAIRNGHQHVVTFLLDYNVLHVNASSDADASPSSP